MHPAVSSAAFAAYIALTTIAISQFIRGNGSDVQAVAIQTTAPFVAPAENVNSRVPMVLTIHVDGPNASVDVYCDTTSDLTAFDELHVKPDDLGVIYYQWCAQLPAVE
jgi:hypothetical protein